MRDAVQDFRCNIVAFRETHDPISEIEDSVLTRTSLLIDCHAKGLEFLRHGGGTVHLFEGEVRVQWLDVPTFLAKDMNGWHVCFEYLIEYLLYVH